MKALWDKLSVHMPNPSCTCYQQCKYKAIHSATNFILEDHTVKFLTCLSDNFSSYENTRFLNVVFVHQQNPLFGFL